eukprot:g4780.t1
MEDRACVYENLWHVPSAARDWLLFHDAKKLKLEKEHDHVDRKQHIEIEDTDDDGDVLMQAFASETNSHAQRAGRWTVRPQRIDDESGLQDAVVGGFALPPLVVHDEVLLVSRSDASGAAHFLYDTVIPAVAARVSLDPSSLGSRKMSTRSTTMSVTGPALNPMPKIVFVDDCSLTGRGATIEFRQQNAPSTATSGPETWFADSLRSYPPTCAIITRQWSDAVFGKDQWTSLSALTQKGKRAVLFRRALSGGMQVFSPWQKDNPYRRPGLLRPVFAQIQDRLAAFAAASGDVRGRREETCENELGPAGEVGESCSAPKVDRSHELPVPHIEKMKKSKYYVTIAVKKSSGRRTITNRDAVVRAVRELVREMAADFSLSPDEQLELVELDVSTPTHLKELQKNGGLADDDAAAPLRRDIQILQNTKLLIANAGTLQDVYAFLLPEKTALYVLPMCVGVRQGCVSESFFFAGLSPTIARREHFVDMGELLAKAMDREDVESASGGMKIHADDPLQIFPTLAEMLSTAGFNFPVDVPRLVKDVRELLLATLSCGGGMSGLIHPTAAKTQWPAGFLDDPFIRLST